MSDAIHDIENVKEGGREREREREGRGEQLGGKLRMVGKIPYSSICFHVID